MSGARDGWAGLDAGAAPAADARDALQRRYDIDRHYARAFATPDGLAVLQHLRALTIEQPAWVPGQDASHGFAREGQDSIVREIEKRIRRAQDGPPQFPQDQQHDQHQERT
jgi:hypothetical protein